MFYQCQKCKKTWQYPIETCLDCFQDLKALESKKIKVVGISKVVIPTILHPNVPYFVLILEDENNNKWVQKSIKGYEIGQEFIFESNIDKNAVALWRTKYDTFEAMEKVIELLGGLKINSEDKILILPTLDSPKHPYFARNTNPVFLGALICYLKKMGVSEKNIKVASQSFDEIPIEASAQKSQLLSICLKHKITPFDLAKGNFVKKEKNGFSCEVSEEVFNADLVINLSALRIDSKFGVAGAVKNSLKFLKKESYLSLQYLSGEEEILEKLQEVLPNYLTLADANVIQKSSGFTVFLGLILAGYNPLNLDRVFAETVMVKDLPEYLKKIKIEDIPLVGREIQEVQYQANNF